VLIIYHLFETHIIASKLEQTPNFMQPENSAHI